MSSNVAERRPAHPARHVARRALRLAFAAAGVLLASAEAAAPLAAPAAGPSRQIEIAARVNARGFESTSEPGETGYHAVVWQGGKAAGKALFTTAATDLEVLDALELLGAEPGNNLSLVTWERRFDAGHPAANARVAGPAIELLVRLPDSAEPMALSAFVEDPGGQGIELRVGGHRAHSAVWRSGCIVCLYSCPASKVSNARYTARDFVRNKNRFRVKPSALPPDGTAVGLILRLADPRRTP